MCHKCLSLRCRRRIRTSWTLFWRYRKLIWGWSNRVWTLQKANTYLTVNSQILNVWTWEKVFLVWSSFTYFFRFTSSLLSSVDDFHLEDMWTWPILNIQNTIKWNAYEKCVCTRLQVFNVCSTSVTSCLVNVDQACESEIGYCCWKPSLCYILLVNH